MSVLAAAVMIGIATISREGKPCVAFEGKLLEPRQAVTLVSTVDAPRRITARIGKRIESCNEELSGTHYELETSEELDGFWFAVVGSMHRLRFRACTSTECLHFLVHRGRRRIFYDYYCFDYAVDPTCRDDEDFP